MKRNEGITLVALIITIVVLLILAMVSINLVINSGIITKTKTAVNKYSQEEELEQIKLAVASAQLKGNGFLTTDNLNNELKGVFNTDETVEDFLNYWYYKGYKIYKDGNLEKGSLLPSEYQQVEYIENSGTLATYIMIQINPLSKIEQYEIKFKDPVVVEENAYDFYPIFGTNNINDTRVYYDVNTGNIGGSFGDMYYLACSPYVNNTVNTVYGESGKIIINGNEFEITAGTNSNSAQYTGVFCIASGGENNPENYLVKSKIYGLKFNRGNLLNLIPCKTTSDVIDVNGNNCSAGTVGFYDIANNQFYTNQGSGQLVAGPEV